MKRRELRAVNRLQTLVDSLFSLFVSRERALRNCELCTWQTIPATGAIVTYRKKGLIKYECRRQYLCAEHSRDEIRKMLNDPSWKVVRKDF